MCCITPPHPPPPQYHIIGEAGLLCWLGSKESTCQGWRCGFHPWVGKIPWRRKWQPISVLPGKSHGPKSLVGPWESSSDQFTQSCLTLCNPMNCNTPGFPVHHQLPELAQTHVHWVGDAIQPSHPLFSLLLPSVLPSIRVFSSRSGLWSGGQRIGASGLPMNIQDWFPLGLTDLISLLSKGLARVFSIATVQKHQFFGTQLSLWSNWYIHTWLLKNEVL